ncbi:hypothetical protein LRS10_07175 [Phenylobacterium sp. J426]|uniref:alginate O-acetyltransferase AlgX-related protein n=1 Tax=Phenylobacterium sp. J426 TaxID=2898439 RepID=UPI0021514194|nr:hypothetical protein [Phenylobacterium sp. J426]MCR5873970.1 hypothetical protein [Phenylobacterium sp. J426]
MRRPRFVRAPDLDENRTLAQAPVLPRTPAGLEAFRTAADAWVADRFPARPHLIGALNLAKMKLGVSGSPRVIVGRDGWLFYDDTTHLGPARGLPPLTDAEARAWLAGLAGRTEALAAQGVPYVVISPPDKELVYPQHGPRWYRGPDPNRPTAMLARLAQASGAGTVLRLEAAMAQPARWGLRLYEPNDTHWTGLGAYVGYAELMRELQRRGVSPEGPRPLESFTEVRRGDPNKPRNLALMLGVASWVPIDYPELEDPRAQAQIRTTWLTGRQDWTAPHVIDTGQAGRPVLLMTMDSFSNALLPFLYPHFSRIVLAHNQDGAWRPDLIERFRPDAVVLEVVENGLDTSLSPAPPASPQALERIERAVANRDALRVQAPLPPGRHLQGTDRNDRLVGTAAGEAIDGRPGDDTLLGGDGPDILRGGRGRDVLDGGPGDDWLNGGREDDILTGGPGADVFNSFAGAGVDRVTDFRAEEGDTVRIDTGVAFTVRQAGADTVVEMAGARLILTGVDAASLPEDAIANR